MTSARALLVGVDDELGSDLENEGIEIDHVGSIDAAVERLATADGAFVDCVVVSLDGADGSPDEIAAAVRADDSLRPVVLTGFAARSAVADQLLGAGVTDYVEVDGEGGDGERAPRLGTAIEHTAERYRARRDRVRVAPDGPDPGFVARDGELVEIADGLADVLGVETADGAPLDELVVEDDRDRLRSTLSAVGEDAASLRVAPVSDEDRVVEIRLRRSPRDGAVVGTIRDVTADAEERAELEDAAAQLDSLLQDVPMSIYFKDRLGRHERVSDYITLNDPEDHIMNAEGKIHPHADDIVGKTDFDLYDASFARETVEDDMRVIEEEERIVNRIESGTTSLGEQIYTSTTKVPRYDDHGDVVGLVGVTIDVTDRVTHREELERQNERLNEFAEVLTHDLRNPLSIATGYVDVLEDGYDETAIEEIDDSLARMESLIEEIRSFVLEGRLVEEPEPVDLRGTASEAWSTVETGDATLAVEGDLELRADRSRLRRLLENLFRNSVEHGSTSPDSQARQDAVEHGSTSPRSTASREDADGTSSDEPSVADAPEDAVEHATERDDLADLTVRVVADSHGFAVADDGVGFEDGDADVFERGYTTSNDGTGFGLAIVESIADAHGWSVTAESSDDGGARFVFSEVVRAQSETGMTITSADSGADGRKPDQ